MKLIVGLGNPGSRYRLTRHNAGFICLDRIAEHYGLSWLNKKGFHGYWADGQLFTERCMFLKPQTYMNNSGLAVASVVSFYKMAVRDVVVLHDDLDVASGKVKGRMTGGDGGHNGVRSIIEHLHSREFHRIKLGVAQENKLVSGESWVLANFSDDQLAVLQTKMVGETMVRLQQIIRGGK